MKKASALGSQPAPRRKHGDKRGGVFGRLRPSYLILLVIGAASLYLFLTQPSYAQTLRFLRPGVLITAVATLSGYLGASVLGLVLAALLLLRLGRRTILTFSVLTAVLAAGSLYFFNAASQSYSLVGAEEGNLAVVAGTPRRAIDEARGTPPRPFRSFASSEAALAALAEGGATGALVPEGAAPEAQGATITLLSDADRRAGVTLAVLAVLLLLLTFGAWTSREHPLAIFAELYVDLVRGIPMLVVLIYVGFVIAPAVRDASAGVVNLPNLTRGILGLMLGYAAYLAEIFRAGIEAVPRGQSEAARSLGLTGAQTMRFVILPQALRIVIPPLGNEFIAMLKDSSLLTILSVTEITQLARQNQSRTFNTFETWNTAALLYLALTLAASSLLDRLERRSKRAER
ncbi:MAG: amino acid ABC transporter permease [Deinococcota bacterium]|nr:amino acid ABC transporter permease [Deinococcota bacterium]